MTAFLEKKFMDWKHELAFRQRKGFVDYTLPSHVASAVCAVVTEAPSSSDADAGGLMKDYVGKFVRDVFFDLGITGDGGILLASVFRVPKPKNIGEGFFAKKVPDASLNPIVRPTPLAPPSRLVYKTYCKKEYEGEIFRLIQTLDFWSLPVFAMGKVPQWAMDDAGARPFVQESNVPFIVNAPNAKTAADSPKVRKRFIAAAENFAEKVEEWRSANSSSPQRKVPAAANRAAEVLGRARKARKKK